MISSTPFDFSSSAFSMNPGTCFMLIQGKTKHKSTRFISLYRSPLTYTTHIDLKTLISETRSENRISLPDLLQGKGSVGRSLPAGGGESTRDTEEDDLLTSGEGVNGDSLELIVLVEEGDRSFRYNIADSNRSHGGGRRKGSAERYKEFCRKR